MTKPCLQCGMDIEKPYTESLSDWVNRHKYCSRACYVQSMKGRLPVSIQRWNEVGVAWNKGKPVLNARGEKHWNWGGGEYRKERHTAMGRIEYKTWRKSVFERDDYTCQGCFKRGGDLEADHIKRWKDNPELRYSVENGRTLCVPCHKQTDTWGKKRLALQEA